MKSSVFSLTLALALLCVTSACPAGVIYEWVDDGGRVHLSDVVPEKYQSLAKRVDSRQFEIPAAEQDEARRQAAKLKAQAASVPLPLRPADPAIRSGAASAPKSGAAASAASDCATWRRRFAISRDCFAGFQLPDGSLRPGAFQTCGNDVPNPEPVCGPEGWR